MGKQALCILSLPTLSLTHALAVFRPLHRLTVEFDGGGVVARTSNKVYYDHGETVTIEPQPNPGWRFDHWEGDVASAHQLDSPLQLTMDAPKNLTAYFVPALDLMADINDDGILDETDNELEVEGDGEYMRVEDNL